MLISIGKVSRPSGGLAEFHTLTASSKGPIQTNKDRVSLQKDIADEVAEINNFKDMVDLIKYENMDLFAKIENSAQNNEETSQLINEIELNPQLRPPCP